MAYLMRFWDWLKSLFGKGPVAQGGGGPGSPK